MKRSSDLKLAIETALNAGSEIMNIYKSDRFKVNIKSDKSPLTTADKISNEIITNALRSTAYPILSEESKLIDYSIRSKWFRFWLIDPIDGTKEFINKNDEFTVNIALIEKNNPILGVVLAPAKGELFFAEKGYGSYKILIENNKYDFNNMIDLSKLESPKDASIVVSRSHVNDATRDYLKLLRNKISNMKLVELGSSLKICKVADRTATCYPRFGPTMEWDTAAAHAVAKFSGCKFSKSYNTEVPIYNKKNILNSNFILFNSEKIFE